MNKTIIDSFQSFAALKGQEIGVSNWLEVPQERIDLFADATLDHQWIHVDKERAAKESSFGQTIAHGYLTLSLLPHLWQQIIEVMVNYGLDKMKFGQAVLSGRRIRLRAKLQEIEDIRGICKAQVDFKIEIENERKPALSGIATFLYYFN